MEEAGLVERAHDDADRRAWRIGLTRAGRRIAERTEMAPWSALRRALDALPRDEKRKLVEILTRLAGHVAHAVERGAKEA
jgi:DNA-binding MarR family transcriptional regulator